MAGPLFLEELSPDYVGEARFSLTLSPTAPAPRAFSAVEIDVDYRRAAPQGVRGPFELTITSPSASGFVRKVLRRRAPTSVTFVPREGGSHLVRIAELGHNRWFGTVVVHVAGEPLDPERAP